MATVTLDRDCQFDHKEATPATYDAKTTMGPWAYMCDMHFKLVANPGFAAAATRLVRENA